MTVPGDTFLEKLIGQPLDAGDRLRLDLALAFCAAVIVVLLVWKPPVDPKVVELAMSNAWIAGMFVLIVYVVGVRLKRSPKAPKPPAVPTLGDAKS